MVSFADLSRRLTMINDLILGDMICALDDKNDSEALLFSKHVLATKHWFGRISYYNKKRYLLALLNDVRSAWTLSLLLKSIWNCRPKDAIMSVSAPNQWLSSYDQAPMDHNRTAIPVSTLKLTMKNDRIWFLSLEPEAQAMLLSELLTVAGGPVMWEVLRVAQTIFENYSNNLMQNIQAIPTSEKSIFPISQAKPAQEKNVSATSTPIPTSQSFATQLEPTQGQKTLEADLAAWNATIKTLRDNLKLEELEMTFLDGTTRKIWKVNRPKPTTMETVDFVQLLPSSIGKRIVSYLPQAQLHEFARVNKYWAYLIEEYRAEVAVRDRIDTELLKLNDIVLKHDESFQDFRQSADIIMSAMSDHNAMTSIAVGPHLFLKPAPSVRASEKSGGGYSLRYFSDKLARPVVAQKPIRNLKELNERVHVRGAIDEHIWNWCENITSYQMKLLSKRDKKQKKRKAGRVKIKVDEVIKKEIRNGILDTVSIDNMNFPCPMMQTCIEVPLKAPLYKDPAKSNPPSKPTRKISDACLPGLPPQSTKRLSLWTRDVSVLYPVLKIPSHQFP